MRAQRYYAHPRNAFWPIARQVLGLPDASDHVATSAALLAQGFALWDVLARCERRGSLDADIRADSVQVNDFSAFLAAHPGIGQVCFNGAAAQALWQRHVVPSLPAAWASLPQSRLPSTSPAHAGMSLAEKAHHWTQVLAQARNAARQRAKSGDVPQGEFP